MTADGPETGDRSAGVRLPGGVTPSHYDIEMAPDLQAGEFTGAVAIDVEIAEAVDAIVCHAAELRIRGARLLRLGDGRDRGGRPGDPAAAETRPAHNAQAGGPGGGRPAEHGIELRAEADPSTERLTLAPRRGPAGFAPGRARLHISFSGVLNDRLRGFYRSHFTDEDGRVHTVAVTQFQSTDARRAFPCWDEPAAKAAFAVRLVVDEGLLAVSNCAETSREPAGGGRVRVSFATTMPMSTYLVAFVVGPLEATEPIDADGVPVRVVHRPGRGAHTAFALEAAAHALRWFRRYYGMDYPSDKVDLVAIPDFAFGAMENLGCVTFREVLLLIDPDTAPQADQQRVADVVNHELAHMWFGNLVTMAWWEGIWLNEAFATFMETACTHAWRPDWRVWSTFGRARASALAVDSLASTRPVEYPVVTPEEAEDMFDILTYAKGAALLRMLEQYLGAGAFRAGVRLYLRRHAYGNTCASDLWDALEEASGQPVRAVMEGWINQGGHPLVRARAGEHGMTLTQRHFALDPDRADDRLWAVPLRLRTRCDGAEREHRVLLDAESRTLTIPPGAVVTANGGADGFFRTDPGPEALAEVAAEGAAAWSASSDERHALVDDVWALTLAGRLDAAAFPDFALKGFAEESDLNVWQALSSALAHLRRILRGAAARRFGELIAAGTSAPAAAVGLDPRPGDDDRTRELRAVLLRLRGAVADHPPAVEACRRRLDHPDPAVAAAALSVAARHGDSGDFRRIRGRYETAPDPQSEQRHLAALADFRDPDLVASILAGTLDGAVRTQDGPYLVRRALLNPDARAWAFVTGRWEDLVLAFPSNSVAPMLEGVVALDGPGQAEDVRRFLASHPVPQGAKQIAQHLERLDVNAAFRRRAAPRLAEAVLSR